MKRNTFIISILTITIASLLTACFNSADGPDDFIPEEITTGVLQVEFVVPKFNMLGENFVHRANLCVAQTPDSLMRSLFVDCANVSDVQETYKFELEPGIYFYQAAITCSAPGDSCLWGAFPGGRMGLKWSMVRVSIDKNKTTISIPDFQ
jgi:hypothetical protein